jgi:hypothetical protein
MWSSWACAQCSTPHHIVACACCRGCTLRSASVLRSVDKRLGGLAKSLVRDLCNYKAQAIAKLTGCVHRTCSLDIHKKCSLYIGFIP